MLQLRDAKPLTVPVPLYGLSPIIGPFVTDIASVIGLALLVIQSQV